jgi:hypothetical protein
VSSGDEEDGRLGLSVLLGLGFCAFWGLKRIWGPADPKYRKRIVVDGAVQKGSTLYEYHTPKYIEIFDYQHHHTPPGSLRI